MPVVDVPQGLMVPTLTRCTTGSQPVLAVDDYRIDAALAAKAGSSGPVSTANRSSHRGRLRGNLAAPSQVARR